KADLVSEYVCRLLQHMDEGGHAYCVPRDESADVERTPLLDFGAGYVKRSLHALPHQGTKFPWRLRMNYLADVVALRLGRLEDGAMKFERRAKTQSPSTRPSAAPARVPLPGR
ncbi:MAG: FAD-containing monooxygenase EthA, partial [Myxococcota bacterium]